MGGEGRNSARRSRRGARRPRRELTPEDRAARVLSDLRELGHDLARGHGFGDGDEVPIAELVLPIAVHLDGPRRRKPPVGAARALVAELGSRIDEALRGQASFRPGRVYCFQSNSADVDHAAPADPADTFAGYTATGKPTWKSFVNLLLERGDPRVDQLWGERARVVTVVQLGSELKGDLLPGFGRGDLSFNVLGQVVAGQLSNGFSRIPEGAWADVLLGLCVIAA